MKKTIQASELNALKECRKIGLTHCVVLDGLVLRIGTKYLFHYVGEGEDVFEIDDVLTWEPVLCVL